MNQIERPLSEAPSFNDGATMTVEFYNVRRVFHVKKGEGVKDIVKRWGITSPIKAIYVWDNKRPDTITVYR